MHTPLRRRAFTMLSLTVAAVATAGIAGAEGPSADDVVADLALDGIGPYAAADLEVPAALTVRDGVLPTEVDPVMTTQPDAPALTTTAAPRAPEVPARASRVASDDSWTGTASWYGQAFHGNLTANGETYDMGAMTAAHKTLPFGTVVEVTNLANGRSVTVRINDRGPFVGDREIDLSRAAARALGFAGLATVELEIV